jgi:2-methylcitrate synthase
MTGHDTGMGVAGTRAGNREISVVSPETGQVTYRGYAVRELCRWCSFEEVAYLLWHGELPSRSQLLAQNRAERAQRALNRDVAAAIVDLPFTARPADVLWTAVRLLGAKDLAIRDNTPTAVHAKTLKLFAVLPSVIAMDQRRRDGLGAVAPRDHLSYAANFLYMTFGRIPEPQLVAAFETCLILNAGQSFDASVSRDPVASPVSDIYHAVAAQIRAAGGAALHAGASEAVMEMMNEIAIPDNAKPWLEEALADGRSIAGFSGRSFEPGDPRVPDMRAALDMIATLRHGQDIIELYDAITAVFGGKELYPNLDFPTALGCNLIGFDTSSFSSIFAAACLPGWTARIGGQLTASPRKTTVSAASSRIGRVEA